MTARALVVLLGALACAAPWHEARAGAADPRQRTADVQAVLDDFGQRGFGAVDVDLQRLRDAKDKAEFDDFMQERNAAPQEDVSDEDLSQRAQ